MAQIKKAVATKVAEKMAKDALGDKIEALENEHETILDNAYKRNLPKEVLEAFENPIVKPFISKAYNTRYQCGELRSYDYSYLSQGLPSLNNIFIDVYLSEFNRLSEIDLAIIDLKENKRRLGKSIESAIVAYRTDKQLAAEFPEAWEVYKSINTPAATKPNLAIPVADIMAELLTLKNS